jgi:N6-adenosine-specific RNA methylase IME4
MWTTFPQLRESFAVMDSWGFEYKTVAFTWIKENPNGSVFLGMGNYTRSNPELVLLGKKGKPKVISHSVENHTRSKIKVHSQKPDIIRNKILELCGDLPRIELFARTKVHGWDVWGNDEKLEATPLESFF